jgi:hypothetical protein
MPMVTIRALVARSVTVTLGVPFFRRIAALANV